MNKVHIFLTVSAVIISVFGCGSGKKTDADGVITMTTSAEWISFGMEGLGKATIDWGDGSKPETKLLDGDWITFSRGFSDANMRTVTISGENITALHCKGIELTALDVSRNIALTFLNCEGNQLTALDVSGNIMLTYLMCNYNQLTALDLTQNAALTDVSCSYNQLAADALNDLFVSLHDNDFEKTVYISGNPGSSDCDPAIAEAKGWTLEGFEGGATEYIPLPARAVIWVDGNVQYLTDWIAGAKANSVFIHGADVYVAGSVDTGNGYVACVWKNGVMQKLRFGFVTSELLGFDIPDDRHKGSFANSVFVSDDGDVYVAGYEFVSPGGYEYGSWGQLWKNGEPQNLGGAVAQSVFVSGGDVYVAGYESDFHGEDFAWLWKNGEPQTLTGGLAYSRAYTVFVADGDVYVAGISYNMGDDDHAVSLWKNGNWHALDKGEVYMYANSVFATNDGDMYACGVNADVGILWKNNDTQKLGNNERLMTIANSIFVTDDGDVYVAGASGYTATLWKNGALQNLFNGVANSVFVANGKLYVAGTLEMEQW